MAYTNIRVNLKSIKDKIERAAENKGRPIARKRSYDLFRRAKLKMLRKFNTHLVTLEIEEGPQAKNISGTLDGYGNLFSYLGFEHGEQPTKEIRDVLEEKTVWVGAPFFSKQNKQWVYKVLYPTKRDLDEAAELPWEGAASWLDIIEHGAPNLQYYLNLRESNQSSRSNYGFQRPYEINEDLIGRKDGYLTKILENFRDTLNNSSVNDID